MRPREELEELDRAGCVSLHLDELSKGIDRNQSNCKTFIIKLKDPC